MGISAIKYGLMSAVLAATAVVGSMVGTEAGDAGSDCARSSTGSLLLAGIGATLMSRLTVDSGYFELAFWGLTIFGAGLGAGCVAAAIASLSDVAGEDAGVASGLQNACFQIGGALGIALLSAVAVANTTGSSPVALVGGYRVAFAACWGFIAVGMVGTSLLVTRSAGKLELVSVGEDGAA